MKVRAIRPAEMQGTHVHAREDDAADSAAERIFAHWVFMLGRNPRRCALGPARRKAIERALALYDEETLLLAIEGCAASAWHCGHNDRETEFNDLQLILRDEAHIERFAADGERLRARALRDAAESRRTAEVVVALNPQPSADEVAEQREALRTLAARLAGRRGATHA